MSIASDKMIPGRERTNVVRVYSYRDQNPQGTLYNPYYNEEIVFGSLTQLVLALEKQMDETDFPQASTQSRLFREKPKMMNRSVIREQFQLDADAKVLATFHLKVHFRQSSSWQGELLWVEGRQQAAFRSVLELIKLIDNTMPRTTQSNSDQADEVAGIS